MTGDIPFARTEDVLRLYRFLRTRGASLLLSRVISELISRGVL